MLQQYGISSITNNLSEVDRHVENINVKGFSILKNVLNNSYLEKVRDSLDKHYKIQEDEFGVDKMKSINELNMLRCPLAYDDVFLGMITNKEVLDIVQKILGNEVLLHLQNGIINHPEKEHHQSSWHRDLPYQEYVISKPLGLSVFYCIDEFNKETGGTILLPYSQKEEKIPSLGFVQENQLQIIAAPGDILIFDCMVYHKAGFNQSSMIRRGVNNVFVAPLLKQQINLPQLLKGKHSDNLLLNMLLGYKYEVASSVKNYREKRLKKLKG